MIIELALGVSAVWATVEHGMPWMVEQQVRLERYMESRGDLSEQQRAEIEIAVEDHLLNNGYRELPRVIVTPMGEPDLVRQRITIRSNHAE